MASFVSDAGWQGYALTGRPDFLNYLRRGDVTWSQLWDFYRETPADSSSIVRLMGLFHAFLCREFEKEGSVVDRDGAVYPQLREWARLAVDCQDYIPEEKVCESLAGLLDQNLIAPLYYEAAFSVYLEACVEKQVHERENGACPHAVPEVRAGDSARLLSIRLSELTRYAQDGDGSRWESALSTAVAEHYETWNRPYATVLANDAEDWRDDGGEG
jgi:hypothetical protein